MKCPETPGCTKGITSAAIKPIYFYGNALALLYVKHALMSKISTVLCLAFEAQLFEGTDTGKMHILCT